MECSMDSGEGRERVALVRSWVKDPDAQGRIGSTGGFRAFGLWKPRRKRRAGLGGV